MLHYMKTTSVKTHNSGRFPRGKEDEQSHRCPSLSLFTSVNPRNLLALVAIELLKVRPQCKKRFLKLAKKRFEMEFVFSVPRQPSHVAA